jgi:phytanoyl-CoA hydroxylase
MSPEQFGQYAVRGYHIARSVFSAAEVASLITHFMEMNQTRHPGDFAGVAAKTKDSAPDPLTQYPRPINMHTWDELTRSLMHDPRLTETASILLQQKAVPIQTMVYYKPPGARGQSFHQDNLYLRHTPLLGAWLALDRADADNGAMQMVRGSHLFGLLPCQLADTDISFTDSETVIPPNLTFDLIALEPGDVVFFGGYMIHGSLPNITTDRFRRAFIAHYQGENALPIVAPPLPSAEAK